MSANSGAMSSPKEKVAEALELLPKDLRDEAAEDFLF
jgi:hypothetical protein